MIRYDYDYNKEMSNAEWKQYLGSRELQSVHWCIRYKHIVGNSSLMLKLQMVVMVIVLVIQILIHVSSQTIAAEQIYIVCISMIDIIAIVMIIKKMNGLYDITLQRQEWKREIILCFITWIIYLFSFVIYVSTNYSIDYIWTRVVNNMCLVLWLIIFCYLETMYVLKKIDEEWTRIQTPITNNQVDSVQLLKVSDILQVQEGFEAMMRHLTS